MVELRIIYTTNAHDFIPSVFPTLVDRTPGNPILQKLRENYRTLRGKYSSVPQHVGVVTVDDIFKRQAQEYRNKLAESDLVKVTTTYLPLIILEAALSLDIKGDDPLQQEYNYRALMYLLSNASLSIDKSVSPEQKGVVYLGSAIPKLDKLVKELEENIAKFKGESNVIVDTFKEGLEIVKKSCPSWKDVEKLYESILERFKKNQVSRDFPLHFFPPGNVFIYMFAVDLNDEVYIPTVDKNLLKYIELGCKARGLDKIPDDLMDLLTISKKDLFGEIELLYNLDDLLSRLSEPKTIITDIYLVDHFPQLKEMDIKTFEFKT